MTALEEIKNPVEAEIERVVQSVNEWDDRTSPDDYPEHLLITSEELADILRNFADVTLESLQRENEELRRELSFETNYGTLNIKNCAVLEKRVDAAEAEVRRLRKALTPFAEASAWNAEGFDLTQDDRPAFPSDIDLMNLEGNSLTLCDLFDARDALASTGGEHHAE